MWGHVATGSFLVPESQWLRRGSEPEEFKFSVVPIAST